MHETRSMKEIIREALAEDLGLQGDITSKALFDDRTTARAVIRSKETGILSGAYLIRPVFREIDKRVTVTPLRKEGAGLHNGAEICRIQGPIRSILAGERTVLNFLQRLSGIATTTARFVSRIQGTRATLLDTRKTTPLLRLLEKRAVAAGGGSNHRFGLFDMILIKDTHVRAAGSPAQAVALAQQYRRSRPAIKIEVEVQSPEEFYNAVSSGPDRIMLDNMRLKDMRTCVAFNKKLKKPVFLEASGNVTLENIRAIAATGVDFISSGAITHSARALDIHLIIL